MLLRFALLAVTVLAIAERPADACCAGCPCTKYRRQTVVVQEQVVGYTHSATGGIPRWSMARISRFLMTGTWRPIKPNTLQSPVAVQPNTNVVIQAALPLRFVTPATVVSVPDPRVVRVPTGSTQVLIRRIEKHGSVILVEVDAQTFKLAPCAGKRGTTCLVEPGDLALDPVPLPGDPPPPPPPGNGGFAQPPP